MGRGFWIKIDLRRWRRKDQGEMAQCQKKEGSPGQKRQWKFKMQKNNDSPFVSIIIVSSVSFAGWLLVERIPGHVRNWGSRGARGEVHSAAQLQGRSTQCRGRGG